MPFSEAYLQAVVRGRVLGDFAPFTLGSEAKIEAYIQKIVGQLRRNSRLLVEADFSSYGSGYASYVEIKISQKDQSDTTMYTKHQRVTYTTTGLLLYVSRLTPYWFYGSGSWMRTYTSGGSHFLEPGHQAGIDPVIWQVDRQWVEAVLTEFRYGLLTAAELEQPAPASITYIRSVLADPPYRVFDCFFYWMD